jgi:hypothetical protein
VDRAGSSSDPPITRIMGTIARPNLGPDRRICHMDRDPGSLGTVIAVDICCGRRQGILPRRTELQARTIVASRERYREMSGRVENAGAGTPGLYLSLPPDLCH